MKKLLIALIALLVVLVVAGALAIYLRPIAIISAANRRTLAKAGFAKSTIDSPVGPQAVFTAGSGPTLIFIHGAGDNAGTWKEVAPRFTDKFHVVALDMAGHGESAPSAGPLKMETMLAGLRAVIEKQPQPVILVGNSLGAWIAMLYASEHPADVTRVVVVDGGPIRGDRVDLAKLPENREDARKIWEAILDPGSPRIPDFILDDVVRESRRGAIGRMDKSDMEQHLVREESLHGYPVSIDILWGKSDRLVPWAYAERMAAALPAVRAVAIARCGHIPQGECPSTFTQELTGTLSLAPAARVAAPIQNAASKKR